MKNREFRGWFFVPFAMRIAAGVALGLFAPRAQAVPMLTVSDGVISVTLTNTNGLLIFNAFPFDDTWDAVSPIGVTKPSLGTSTNPGIELYGHCSSQMTFRPRDLSLTISETDFGPISGVLETRVWARTTSGPSQVVTFNTYYDSNNIVGAKTTPLGSFTGVLGATSTFATTRTKVAQSLFSLTAVLTFGGTPFLGNPTSYAFDCDVVFVPLPPPVLGFASAQPLSTNGLALMLETVIGGSYQVDASSDLISWTTVTNFVSTNSTMYFLDPAATNCARRFYRASGQ